MLIKQTLDIDAWEFSLKLDNVAAIANLLIDQDLEHWRDYVGKTI